MFLSNFKNCVSVCALFGPRHENSTTMHHSNLKVCLSIHNCYISIWNGQTWVATDEEQCNWCNNWCNCSPLRPDVYSPTATRSSRKGSKSSAAKDNRKTRTARTDKNGFDITKYYKVSHKWHRKYRNDIEMTHSCFRVFWPWPFQDKCRGRIGPCFILISLSYLLEPKVWCSDQSIRPAEDLKSSSLQRLILGAATIQIWNILNMSEPIAADSCWQLLHYISLPAWRARQTLWATLGHWTLQLGPPQSQRRRRCNFYEKKTGPRWSKINWRTADREKIEVDIYDISGLSWTRTWQSMRIT